MYTEDINAFAEKFNYYKTAKNNGDIYKLIMNLLYRSEMHKDTQNLINNINPKLNNNYRNYCNTVIEQVANVRNNHLPDATFGTEIQSLGNIIKKHLLIGNSFKDNMLISARSFGNGNKWFKFFGTITLGLIGATLAADTFIPSGKVKVKQN